MFGGNCGFALAPASEEHVDYLARLMARVEGIPLAALQQGLPWDWKSFGDYLDRVEDHGHRRQRGFLAGHSRGAARGDGRGVGRRGSHRRPDRRRWNGCCTSALDSRRDGLLDVAGARRTTTATATRCRRAAATRDELLRLAGAVRSHPGTQLELIIAGCLNGFSDDEVDLMASMSLAADRPVNWNVLGVAPGGMHERQLDAARRPPSAARASSR